MVLLVIIGGLANKNRNKAIRERARDSQVVDDAPAPWRDSEPFKSQIGRHPGMFRPYEQNSLSNCTVVVLEEIPGQTELERSIMPWRPDNEFWSIEAGIITASVSRDKQGATKTYLVFNGLDLRSFLVAFIYRAKESDFGDGNFGLFYRCQNLGKLVFRRLCSDPWI